MSPFARCLVATILSCGIPAAPVLAINWVHVFDPGNTEDDTGYGKVDAVFSISTTEITNAQYVEFLNAVAASDDYELYNAAMDPAHEYPPPPDPPDPESTENFPVGSVSNFGGIVRSGLGTEEDPYSYTLIPGRENLPVNHVNYFDALRYVNWLHNGKGGGDTETGAYTLLGGFVEPSNGSSVTREESALYALPNEDEWYKAAYYDTTSGSYFDYPTNSDTLPACGAPSAAADVANCGNQVGDLVPVGSYPGAVGPNGTLDQAGNVLEWVENQYFSSGRPRVIRGGSFYVDAGISAASTRSQNNALAHGSVIGFRVVPEPAGPAGVLAGSAALALLAARRRRVSSR